MSTPVQMVTLEEADLPSLRQHAGVTMGLETTPSMNGNALRSRIQKADASITEIPMFVPTGPGPARSGGVPGKPTKVAEDEAPPVTANGISLANYSGVSDPLHHNNDPKVTLRIFKTDDRRRSKDCDVQVNGVTFRLQRDKDVEVPYRVYEALVAAKESAAVDGDEINPVTGDPIKVWTDVPSYPFQVSDMPSKQEVQAWRDATSALFQQAAA